MAGMSHRASIDFIDFIDFIMLAALKGASFLFMRAAAREFGATATAGLRVGFAASCTKKYLTGVPPMATAAGSQLAAISSCGKHPAWGKNRYLMAEAIMLMLSATTSMLNANDSKLCTMVRKRISRDTTTTSETWDVMPTTEA